MVQPTSGFHVYSELNTWIDFMIIIDAYEDFKEDESYCNDGYAQIKWGDEDNSMRIWQVTSVSEPMKIDGKDWN